jgi:hypothetical protein
MHWEIEYLENKSSKQSFYTLEKYWGHKKNKFSKLLVVWGVCLLMLP